MDALALAVAQSPVTCNPVENGVAVGDLMRRAHDAGARVVVFPEGAISGYVGQAKDHYRGWNIDWVPVRRELERVAELAAELGLWVVIGGNHQLTPPNRPHNSLYVISNDGTVVARYDKRLLSFTEITDFYSPGFDPVVVEIDGFRFGLALCIEVNFPELFLEYLALDVDCILFSSFSEDPVFGAMALGHAAANNLWISVSVPAQCSRAMPSGVIGPHGSWLARCRADGSTDLAIVRLDRRAPELDVALNAARPWRATARAGELYEARRVDDPRSSDRRSF